jgi:hypothetical protein
MKPIFTIPLCCAALALAGCTSLLGGDNPNKLGGPSATAVPVGNSLVMPPDLQLPAPGTGPDPSMATAQGIGSAQGTGIAPSNEPPGLIPPIRVSLSKSKSKPTDGTVYTDTGAVAPPSDVFAANGISLTKPDGTKKTQAELSAELRAVLLRKKREKNPNYGTIANIGNIFNDQ